MTEISSKKAKALLPYNFQEFRLQFLSLVPFFFFYLFEGLPLFRSRERLYSQSERERERERHLRADTLLPNLASRGNCLKIIPEIDCHLDAGFFLLFLYLLILPSISLSLSFFFFGIVPICVQRERPPFRQEKEGETGSG